MRISERGQGAAEFALSLAVWAVIWSGFVQISTLVLTRYRAHRVARLGTMLQATGCLSESVVCRELDSYQAIIGKLGGSRWSFEIGRFLETPASRFYRLVKTRVRVDLNGFAAPMFETVVAQQENRE